MHGNKSVETLFFEKVYSGKGLDLLPSCYKATHEITQTDSDFLRQFIIKFNESFVTEDIPKMTIYFTSESNSYGITQKRWVDGRVFETDLEIERYCKQTAEDINKFSLQFIIGRYKRIDIYPERYIYHDDEGECTNENTFYECFGSYILKLEFEDCPRKCLPLTLPPNLRQNEIPLCQTSEEWKCAKALIWNYHR